MLPGSHEVNKLHVDHLHLVLLRKIQHFFRGHSIPPSPAQLFIKVKNPPHRLNCYHARIRPGPEANTGSTLSGWLTHLHVRNKPVRCVD